MRKKRCLFGKGDDLYTKSLQRKAVRFGTGSTGLGFA